MRILQSHLMQLGVHRKEMSHTSCNNQLIQQIDISYCSTIRIKGKAVHPQNIFDKKGGVILFQKYYDKSGEVNSGKYEKHYQVINQSDQRQQCKLTSSTSRPCQIKATRTTSSDKFRQVVPFLSHHLKG